MFWKNSQFQEKYYQFFISILKIGNKVELIPLDFEKPWWSMLYHLKLGLFVAFSFNTLNSIFQATLPIVIGYIISSKDWNLFYYFFAVWVGLSVYIYLFNPYWILLYDRTAYSLKYWANRFFLTTDPVFHSTKASGQILAKIDRSEKSFGDFLFLLTEDLLPTLVGLISAVASLYVLGIWFGLIGTIFITTYTALSVFVTIVNTRIFQKKQIALEDDAKQIAFENLSQTMYVRSLFATTDQDRKARVAICKTHQNIAWRWRTVQTLFHILEIFFFVFAGYMVYFIVNGIESGNLNVAISAGVLISFISQSSQVFAVGIKAERMIQAIMNVEDLYSFIRSFGKQSFPVLVGEHHPNPLQRGIN